MARPSQQLDQALLAAGRALLPAAGCAGLSVRSVADRAGTVPGMFHYHFGSKERFLRTLLAGVYDDMYAALSQQAAQEAPPIERLRASLQLLAHFAREHRRLLARLWSDAMAGEPAARDFFRLNAPRHMALLLQLIGQAQADGTMRELPPLTAFSLLMGAVPLPLIFAAGLVDGGLSPPGGKAAFEAQVMSDEAIDLRIELVLAAVGNLPPHGTNKRSRT